MPPLAKATLEEVTGDKIERVIGDPIHVQFNPTSLKFKISNRSEGGANRARQTRQYLGNSSTTLSLELIFDTADEGTADNPRSVLDKTKEVERFLLPKSQKPQKQAPPKLRFSWGGLVLRGIVDGIDVDLELFAANGVPLRAKVSLSIKAQDPEYQLGQKGPAANKPPPEKNSAGLGSSGGGPVDQSALAIGGESAAEFAARNGLDPAAWRGLSLPGDDSLTLPAGAEIGFSAGLSASLGLGVTAGVEAGLSASLETSFGLEGGANAAIRADAGLSAGFSLSAAGGVSAALERVQAIRNETASAGARDAFRIPAPNAADAAITSLTISGRPTAPPQARTALKNTGVSDFRRDDGPAPRPPRADPRASSFGFGVPLRPRLGGAIEERDNVAAGAVALRSRKRGGLPGMTDDRMQAPWLSLSLRGARRSHARRCSCRGSCCCRGGQ